MNNRFKTAAGATLLVLMTTAAPAWAAEPAVPAPACATAAAPGEMTISGTLTWVDLEGGYYSVAGWALQGEHAQFAPYLGQEVTVTGLMFDGMTAQMVQSFVVSTIGAKCAEPEVKPISAPVVGGLYDIPAMQTLPAAVAYEGKTIKFDQEPVIVDGYVMVPLRHVVEAAGGTVAWDGATQTVTVTMPDRMAYFQLGANEAEMNENGVRYIQRNMIKMAAKVTAVNGRTLISTDALTNVLGLLEQNSKDMKLDLYPRTGLQPMHAQAVGEAEVPAELTAWREQNGMSEKPSFKAVQTEKGIYLAVAGGLLYPGGTTMELVSTVQQPDGGWLVQARAVKAPGPIYTMMIMNPVGYYFMPDAKGDVKVEFLEVRTMTADEAR